MKKTFFMIGKILLVLVCIVFLPLFFVLYIWGGRSTPNGKPVSSPPPPPISVDQIEKAKILIEASTSVEEVDEVFEDCVFCIVSRCKVNFKTNDVLNITENICNCCPCLIIETAKEANE